MCDQETTMHLSLLLCIFALVATTTMGLDTAHEMKTASDQFTAKMFQELVKAHNDSSSVLSAFSVLSPLTQLALAAEGQTHNEILKVTGFKNDDVAKQVFTDLHTNLLSSVKGIELKQANKIYVRNDYSLNTDFAVSTKGIFNSEIQNIDFTTNDKAAKEINKWVEDQTNKRITNLVNPQDINEQTAAILVNAIYFQGNWTNQFTKSATQDRHFHATHDKTISLPMMYQRGDFKYADSQALDAQILEMEYQGGDASLIVVLPKKVDGVHELITKLKDLSQLNKAIQSMTIHDVSLSLPKFKIETTTDIKTVLQNMNIKSLFDPNEAKLTRLLKDEKHLYINSAIQKTYINVDEAGTEAAAATEMVVGLGVAYNPNIVTFEADHPFVFFLIMKKYILFSGVFLS